MEKLTLQEETCMRCIWSVGNGFIKDYMEAYPDPKLPYTTLASIIKNLEKKAYLTSQKRGMGFEYLIAIEEKDYKSNLMEGVVSKYFKNSYHEVVTFFVKEKGISPAELKELADLIENQSK